MEEGTGSARPDPGGPEETGSEEQGSRGEPSHRRMTHNMVERRRKDKIKQWISHIAQLLPPVTSAGPDNRPSTLDIMERAAKFISELKASYEQVVTEKGDPVLVAEMNKMRNEIEKLNRERDHLADVIKAQGISLQVDTSQWKGSRRNDSNGPSTSAADNDSHLSGDNSSDGSSKKKSSRRQNTVSAHLEQQKLQEQQQQQALSQLISQNGAAVMPGQSLLLNPLASPSGAMSSAQQTSAAATSSVLNTPTSIGSMQQEATSPVKHPMNNACGLGLLQIAMQDAGITQMDTSQQASPAPASDLQGDPGSADSRMHLSQMDESHENLQALRENLQTLASAASSKGSSSNLMFTSMPSSGMVNMMQVGNASSASLAANNVTVTSSAMTQNTPIMSVGQLSSHPQSASQSNMIMGMNFVNSLNQNAGLGMVNPGQGQVLLPGAPQSGPAGVIPGTSGLSPGTILLNQQGNVLIINENGIPVPYDSTTGTAVQSEKMTAVMGSGALSVSSNSALLSAPAMSVLDQQQQALINSGALTLGKTDHAVSSALASLNVSQPQASILAGMNSQMAGGMNFLGSQLLTQNALQSLAVQQGNPAGGFLNQQLLQSMGMPFPGMIAGSAAGGVTNTSSSQASQAIPGSAATGLAPAGGNILFPTNQAGGMVALNTIPSNPQHLPSAFVLPSGHVIPVVSNPQLVPPGQPGGVMAAPGGSAAAGQLQLPHMAAGPGGAGQVIQMDSGSNPGNPQIIIGPNGLQVAAPPAGQGALTQQQQLQQILQQQQQQGISLMMPTPTINVSQTSTMTTPSVVTLATNAVPMSSMKTVTARSSLATSKVVTMTTQPPTPRSASHGRSQTPSSANRKSQSAKVAAPDIHNSIPNSTAGMVIQTSKGALASLAQNTAGIASTCNSSGAPVGGGAGGGGGGGVVLMMQHNGQTLNVLVDPVTFQVLNPAQSAPAQALSIAPAASLAAISSSDTPANTTAVSSAPKKSKKGGSAQRAIFPKPKSKSSSKASAASKAAAVSLAASTAAVTSASTPLMISTEAPWGDQNAGSGMLSERTAGSGGAELPCADNQDILAKAAESIFTTEEISPPLVYSPTNDDNPLLIDTSAHDGEEERGSASSPKKGITTPKTTPVVAERAKKSQKQDHQKQLLAFQQEQQKQLQESSLLLQQQIQTSDAMQGSLLQQQSPLASAMEQDPNQLLQQQEQEEQKKLQQQQQEQHDHLMRHLESQIALTSSTSQPLPVVPPSMPTLMSPISVPSPTPTTSTSEITPTAPTVSPAPAAATPATAPAPAPKKSKKSKKKKDKDKEESSDKGADGAVTKSSKKASSKKKKKEEEEARISEAALKRREEIDKKQQQLLLQQQEEQLRRKEEDEDEELRPQQGDQLLLLQQQQLRQAELMPGGIEDGSIVIVRSMRESLNTFPETLEFAPGELCAVLDQVENLGQLAQREEEEVKPAEKVSEKPEKPAKKSKKSRDASSDSAEPAAKKSRKSNNSKENSASANANMFLFSPQMNFPLMPQQHAASDELTSSSRMSIYDFQDDSPPTTAAKQETSKSKSKKGSKSKASTSVPPSTILSSTMNITTSAAMASSTNTLDSLMPVTPQSKSSDSLNTPKPAKAKSKKSDKKSNSAASSSASGGNCNVSSASVSSVSDSLVTTMTSSKSNDSISTSDSVSVILPMPGFDTLESLNSPAPLISPPITSQKSALPENRTPSQTSVQSAETALGQLSSVVSSDVSKSMSVIDSLPDIGDIAAQAGSVETPILQSSQPTLPPVLHHPPQTQNHMDNTSSSSNNSGGSVSQMMQQQQKQSTPPQPSQQKQQQQQPPSAQQQQQQQQQQPPQQQSTSTKPHQQASPRQNQLPQPPQIANHTPPVLATPQQGQTQAHPQMGPPTSPAQAVVGRPRSATSHTLQGAAYPATSPQAGGMHTSPSASCISPSSNHSRSSHDGFNQAGGHLAPSPSAAAAARMTDMSSLLGGPDMPCPNANLFAASTPKLSHVQKAQSQGKMCSEDSAASRTRPGIFSADNFVQPSPSSIDPRSQQQPPQQQQQQSSSSDSVAGMGRLPGMNDVTGESFNFTSISLNLTSASSQNAGQEMGIASSAGVPFSFSLTSATTTQTSTSVSNNSHSQAAPPAFPFYTSQPSSTNQLPPQQGPSLSMLNMPDLRMDNHSHQPPPRQQGIGAAGPPMPSSSQNSFNFGGLMEMGGSCSVGRENPSMGRPVDKSPMAGFSQQHSSAGAGGGSSAGGGAGGGGSGQKRLVEIPPPQQANHPAAQQQQQQQQQPTQPLDHVPPINRSPQMGSHSSKSSSYFPSPNFPSSANLNTPPLRHPPLPSSESGHLMNRAFDHGFGASQTSNSVPLGGQSFDPRGMPYQKDLNQTRPLEHVSSGTSSSSRKPGSQQQQQQQQQQGGGGKQKQGHSPAGSGGNAMGGVTTHSQSRSMAPSQNASHSSASSQRSASAQPPPPAHQTSGSGHPPAPSPSQQQARSAKRKQASSSSSQSKKKPTYTTEIDANLSHNIFDSNQSFPSLFSFQNMSPPPGRNMQSEGPPFLTSNFFGAPSRPLSNSSNKNTPDLGPPYSVFPPSRQQNGIGINFQHGFGMQAMTGNHGGPMTPHSVAVTPHMSNFSLGNIFPDVNGGAGDSGLNISPIKFPHHGQPILPPPQPGMDPNALQHPHQGSALYHNRGHHGQPHMLPNAMTLNSILGHNHHGFDTRPMTQGINSGVGPPFHGPGHPTSFAMPPLNFSMHEH